MALAIRWHLLIAGRERFGMMKQANALEQGESADMEGLALAILTGMETELSLTYCSGFLFTTRPATNKFPF